MDFFRNQDQARRNTGRLVFLFSMAVLSLIVMTNLLVMTIFGYLQSDGTAGNSAGLAALDWQVFGVVSIGVLLVVGLGSAYKIMALSGGGASVAESLGGRLIDHGSTDPDHRKILNVVEEMAIASGSPVPPVYLLDEPGINAFAAGHSPSDAVIGVTSGAVKKLSRDELQGVIAHEFSHINNGDMRLNIKLIGFLHGIVLLGLIGFHILRGSAYARSSRRGGGGGLALGLGLMVIGFAGTFFGNVIRAAVSRQREFLADASAVQFTRNPDGIGGALQRIAADSNGSLLENSDTKEISHALFSQGFSTAFAGLFATHPPLETRIRKIKPDWDGSLAAPPRQRKAEQPAAAGSPADSDGRRRSVAMAATAMAHIGNPGKAHLGYARQLISKIPAALRQAVHEPYAARAVVYGLLLDADEEMCSRQLERLQEVADTGVHEETVRLQGLLRTLPAQYRLPLLDMALPTLRRLSRRQYELFMENIQLLIAADGTLSLFEWTLQKIVHHHLASAFADKPQRDTVTTSLHQSGAACSMLLSLLVYSNQHQGLSEQQVFAAAARELPELDLELLERRTVSFQGLDQAIDRLAALKPLEKEKVIRACATCILADRTVLPLEVELLRAIADTLNCPMPPLLIDGRQDAA
ncbi:MAG: heat-shock protein HtpX [Desulfobulbaceae bacterium]|nr:MAG: heat-shock protein HtpX [Desulfobulbaceae bacterium]